VLHSLAFFQSPGLTAGLSRTEKCSDKLRDKGMGKSDLLAWMVHKVFGVNPEFCMRQAISRIGNPI
jgi:hypothetical protein